MFPRPGQKQSRCVYLVEIKALPGPAAAPGRIQVICAIIWESGPREAAGGCSSARRVLLPDARCDAAQMGLSLFAADSRLQDVAVPMHPSSVCYRVVHAPHTHKGQQ